MPDSSTRDKPGMFDKQRDAQNEELLLFQYVVPSSPWAQGLHKCWPSPIWLSSLSISNHGYFLQLVVYNFDTSSIRRLSNASIHNSIHLNKHRCRKDFCKFFCKSPKKFTKSKNSIFGVWSGVGGSSIPADWAATIPNLGEWRSEDRGGADFGHFKEPRISESPISKKYNRTGEGLANSCLQESFALQKLKPTGK